MGKGSGAQIINRLQNFFAVHLVNLNTLSKCLNQSDGKLAPEMFPEFL
jgi:hypothetical protein